MSDEQALAGVIEVIRKADTAKPTKEAKDEFNRMLQEHPTFWRVAGDVIENTAQGMIKDMGGTYAIRTSLQAGWTQIRENIAQPGDGALEELLIQQVALCWLKLAYTEWQHKYYLTTGSTTITQCDFWERRLSAAQRRYLRACETLARVRRLQLPAVQVNIGAQQVNQVNQGGD